MSVSNRIIIDGCIKKFVEENELSLDMSESFEVFSLAQIFKDKNLSYQDIFDSIVDGGQDGGIDAVLIFVDGELILDKETVETIKFNKKSETKIIFAQCKKEKSFKEGALDKLITTMPSLLDLEKTEESFLSRFNPSLVDKILLLIEIWKTTMINGGSISVDVYYVTNADQIETCAAFDDKKQQLAQGLKVTLSTAEVKIILLSSQELLYFYTKQKSNRLSLEFKDRPLTAEFGENGLGYIGTVKLGAYKKFLTTDSGEIADELFESNIRHYHGSSVDVNKKIMSSLQGINQIEDFWWLNNGITIIAEEPKEVGKKLSIENVQIVNGLQTSYSIYNHYNIEVDDERSVLVKVIINKDKKIVDNIIASTNSQNPVSATLLRATEDIQRNLELFFFNEGYFYDRRKNYYKNQGKPASRIFSIQVVAQAIESILFKNPHGARSAPTTLLKLEASYSRIFDESRDYKIYLNCSLLNSKIHSQWILLKDKELKSKLANFKLHLSYLYPLLLLKKEKITEDDLKVIDTTNLDLQIFSEAVRFIDKNIDEFLSKYPSKNLINIAKAKEFTSFLSGKVLNHCQINLTV